MLLYVTSITSVCSKLAHVAATHRYVTTYRSNISYAQLFFLLCANNFHWFSWFLFCVNSMTFPDSGHTLASTHSCIVFSAPRNLLALDTTVIFGFWNRKIGRTNRRSSKHELGFRTIIFTRITWIWNFIRWKRETRKKRHSKGRTELKFAGLISLFFFVTGWNRYMMMPFAVKTDQGFYFFSNFDGDLMHKAMDLCSWEIADWIIRIELT